MQINGDIIVGVDGSEGSCEAAAWALKEARRTGARLRLAAVAVTVSASITEPPTGDPAQARAGAEAAVARVRERLAGIVRSEDEAQISTEIHDGDPAEVLASLSHSAGLIVIGHHGSDQPASGRIGTVSAGLPGHALCPVLVHRAARGSELSDPEAHPRGEVGVIVGLDSSEYAGLAGLAAAAYAQATGAALRILVGTATLPDDQRVRAQTDLDMTWLRSHIKGLDVTAEFVDADPVDLLIERSADADMLVMGKRGTGRFTSMIAQLGRTTDAVLPRAACSLLVVPFADDAALTDRRLAD